MVLSFYLCHSSILVVTFGAPHMGVSSDVPFFKWFGPRYRNLIIYSLLEILRIILSVFGMKVDSENVVIKILSLFLNISFCQTHSFHWYFTSALPRSLLVAYPLFLVSFATSKCARYNHPNFTFMDLLWCSFESCTHCRKGYLISFG